MNKKLLIVVLILVVSAISFARSLLGLIGIIPWHYGYSDIFNEDRIIPEAKKIPYLEKPIEYPVITGFFIYFMWYFGKNLLGYVVLTWIFLTIFTIITSLTLYKLVKILKIDKKRLFWFVIFAPSLIVFGVYNWDVIAIMFMVLAIYFFHQNKHIYSAVFLSLGFSAKLFPVVLLPIMLLKTDIKKSVKMVIVFLSAFLLLNGYFIVNSLETWKTTYIFHSLREPNIDSIWALTGLSTSAINILSLALFLVFYFALIYNHKRYDFIALSFASVLLLLIFNKIFSPQYILWLLPFFVLSNVTKKVFYSLETSNLIVFFSSLNFIFASKEQIFLSISKAAVIARILLLAYIVYSVLVTNKKKDLSST